MQPEKGRDAAFGHGAPVLVNRFFGYQDARSVHGADAGVGAWVEDKNRGENWDARLSGLSFRVGNAMGQGSQDGESLSRLQMAFLPGVPWAPSGGKLKYRSFDTDAA